MTTKLEHALALAARGFRVFPLRANSKLPAIKGWPEKATTNPDTIKRWWAENPEYNIGIATGGGLLVLDVDVKDGKRGVESLEELQMLYGELPACLGAVSPTGSLHFYMEAGRDTANSAGKIGAGLDTRSHHGYVVAPGSTIDGVPYRWLNDEPTADAPDWLLNLLDSPTPAKSADQTPVVEPDKPEAVARAIAYLEHEAPLAIEGAAGDHTTYKVAARLKDFGLSEQKTLELMLDHWNDRCAPPWSPEELERKTANAFRYGQEAPGSKSPEADFGPVGAPLPDDTGPFSADEMSIRQFPRAEYVWEFGVVIVGHPNLITGDGGVGKTTFNIQMGAAVAAGVPLLGHATRQMPVLLVLCEDDYGEVKHRLGAACGELGIDTASLPLTVWCRPNHENSLASIDEVGSWRKGPFYDSLRKHLKKMGPCLCFLDPASDLFEMDETKRLAVNAMAKKVLGTLQAETGATFVINHHPSKKSMEDGSYYSGTTAWRAAFRSMLVMEAPDKASPRRILRVSKSQYRRLAEAQVWAGDGFFSEIKTKDAQEAAARAREAVLDIIRKLRAMGVGVVKTHGTGHKPAEVAALIEESFGLALGKRDVMSHMAALEREGLIKWAPRVGGKGGRPATYEICTAEDLFGDKGEEV